MKNAMQLKHKNGINYVIGQHLKYSHFTHPKNVRLLSGKYQCQDNEVTCFMELLNSDTAQVLASYDHYNWKRYAAVTKNSYGKGTAFYLGCKVSDAMLREILCDVLKDADLWNREQEVEFPVIIKKGTNDYGKEVVYYLNYSPDVQSLQYWGKDAKDLLTGESVCDGKNFVIEPWNLRILERA